MTTEAVAPRPMALSKGLRGEEKGPGATRGHAGAVTRRVAVPPPEPAPGGWIKKSRPNQAAGRSRGLVAWCEREPRARARPSSANDPVHAHLAPAHLPAEPREG